MAAGASGLGAAVHLAGRYGLIPPDHAGILGVGETLTYATQRLLTSGHSLAREFKPSEISEVAPVNGPAPRDETYQDLLADGFKDWRLEVEGLIARPTSFSLAELKRLPAESHILLHACEEGWSYIAEWIGTPLSLVLREAGLKPEARFLAYSSIQPDWWGSLDIPEALHPGTLITSGMNDGDLPVGFGGPLRLRVPRQLGYKSVKFLTRITATDSMKSFGKGLGSSAPEGGYAWYAGI
jgi:DMSO/TMAO reductase YedYZ molybdopterin-dependent catalytic subunit